MVALIKAVHDQGVIIDVTEGNVLFDGCEESRKPYVVDFGGGQIYSECPTGTGSQCVIPIRCQRVSIFLPWGIPCSMRTSATVGNRALAILAEPCLAPIECRATTGELMEILKEMCTETGTRVLFLTAAIRTLTV